MTAGAGQNADWKDQLKSYCGQVITYDASGNPTNYRGKTMTWKGRRLIQINSTSMEYDYNGLRVKKGNRFYFWQGENLIMERWEENGEEKFIYYYYDESGVAGMYYNGSEYYFRRNILGDVLAVYGNDGTLYCRYVYDAWGNHKIYDADGNELSPDSDHIGLVNPFRYRGYYYDSDFNLYYLQSRYYDPALGRFISADDIDYLEPENVHGLNLYAYCGDNPAMNSDPAGTMFLSILLCAVIGAAAAAIASYAVQKATDGDVDWKQVGISAGFGAVSGILSFTGVGGAFGQFAIQGLLSVGETFSIAALQGTISSISIDQIAITFLFAGTLGALGAKDSASQLNRIGQIEKSFIKYTARDVIKKGASLLETILKRGAKYGEVFLKPTLESCCISTTVSAVVNIVSYWIQKLCDNFSEKAQ